MTQIDWGKAPDWAIAHGLHETGFGIKEFWLGETQYQNLEHAKSFPYGGGDPSCGSFHNSRRESFSYVTQRPAPWGGKGLPPLGCELEAGFACEDFRIWHKGICVAVGEDPEGREEFCVVKFGNKIAMYRDEGRRMRAIRTPAQIAAEEREKAANELADEIAGWSGRENPTDRQSQLAMYLYDQCYRKVEVKP